MSSVSHQTVKLSKGKHGSPEDGACVMELASMLAGEAFSDHPVSVCPVIGAFLRAYNDWIDDDRRQDLYQYASRVVGSRGDDEIQRARADRMAAWSGQSRRRGWTLSLLPAWLRGLGGVWRPPNEVLGAHAVRSIVRLTDASHAAALSLIDELLEIRTSRQAPPALPAPEPISLRRHATLGKFGYGDLFW
jgi:hypothetical protein